MNMPDRIDELLYQLLARIGVEECLIVIDRARDHVEIELLRLARLRQRAIAVPGVPGGPQERPWRGLLQRWLFEWWLLQWRLLQRRVLRWRPDP